MKCPICKTPLERIPYFHMIPRLWRCHRCNLILKKTYLPTRRIWATLETDETLKQLKPPKKPN
jgi:hypothetical protein